MPSKATLSKSRNSSQRERLLIVHSLEIALISRERCAFVAQHWHSKAGLHADFGFDNFASGMLCQAPKNRAKSNTNVCWNGNSRFGRFAPDERATAACDVDPVKFLYQNLGNYSPPQNFCRAVRQIVEVRSLCATYNLHLRNLLFCEQFRVMSSRIELSPDDGFRFLFRKLIDGLSAWALDSTNDTYRIDTH